MYILCVLIYKCVYAHMCTTVYKKFEGSRQKRGEEDLKACKCVFRYLCRGLTIPPGHARTRQCPAAARLWACVRVRCRMCAVLSSPLGHRPLQLCCTVCRASGRQKRHRAVRFLWWTCIVKVAGSRGINYTICLTRNRH